VGSPLSVLIVEDSQDDADLLVAALRGGGYDLSFERVETSAAMEAALERSHWDVIVSDFSLPSFSAPAALALLQRKGLDLPFIIVSGTVGDEVAVVAMKAGAHDFIAKGRLVRLLPALERELREGKVRAEQRKMRDQLVISERMATAGTLAAGVAHEINNPLAVVAANLEFLAGVLGHADLDARAFESELATASSLQAVRTWLRTWVAQMHEPLGDAREATGRIRDIVRDVKLFSRSQDETRGPVEVRSVIESSIRMAWNEIRHRAQLIKEYGDVPTVDANQGRLGQVVLNLLVNAAQAIPEGHAKKNRIRVSTRLDGRGRVAIEVSDTGQGIPPELLDRIFEPFFTTKPIGVGTGLGLAICHRIVTDLGGELEVESQVGQGTLFRVSLPISPKDTEAATAAAPTLRATRRARVLLVDDEVTVSRSLQRILTRHHDVSVSNSGREVLARVAAGERFDVIVSDLMMPEVTGMEVHAQIARVAPEQATRMVFLTGGAFTTNAREFLDTVPNARIEKPVELETLLAVIEGLL
jgi:signal transduction histidine kinase